MEHFVQPSERKSLDGMSWRTALGIGLFQCFALWPGVSRSASTILGAMILGVRRKEAAEYSFFIAVPALLAACAFDLIKSRHDLQADALPHFALGFIVAFVSALVAIKFFIRYVSRHTLAIFGWYRLVLAVIVFISLR
jgi:undecaprenyl-diphosphatase